MASIQRSVDVDCPPERLFDIIADYEAYPDFLDDVVSAHVEERGEDYAVVTFGVTVGKRITYTVRLDERRPDRVEWRLVRGQLMRSNSGSWELEELDGKTRAHYRVDLRFASGVPDVITKSLVEHDLPHMLDQFKLQAEQLT